MVEQDQYGANTLHMYVNVESIPRTGGRRDKREWWRG
jgi:hypothetical protein